MSHVKGTATVIHKTKKNKRGFSNFMLLILLTIAPDLTTADTMTNVMLQSRHIKLKVTKRVNKKNNQNMYSIY